MVFLPRNCSFLIMLFYYIVRLQERTENFTRKNIGGSLKKTTTTKLLCLKRVFCLINFFLLRIYIIAFLPFMSDLVTWEKGTT